MAASCKEMPFELLAHIVSYLSSDRQSLRNISLANRTLDIISKPHLFATMGFRDLSRPHLIPLRHFVRDVTILWDHDMFRTDEAQLLKSSFTPYFSPEALPRLRCLEIGSLGPGGMAYLSTLAAVFAPFNSLESLTLSQTCHRSLHEVQELVCSLPRLKNLYLDGVSWTVEDQYTDRSSTSLMQRLSLQSLRLSSTYPTCTLRLVRWLGQTSSATSLKRLDVSFLAMNAPALVLSFGSSVQHLLIPVRRLQSSDLEHYIALRSLTLFVHEYNERFARWEELPIVISSLPAPSLLRSLTLQYELRKKRIPELGDVVQSAVLQQVDRILFAEDLYGESDIPHRPFGALETVTFAVRKYPLLSEERRTSFEGLMRLCMPCAQARGILVVVFEA